MEKQLYLAAMKGKVDFLSEVRNREIESGCWDNFIQSLTPQQNNVIHIASQHDQLDFLNSGFNFMIFTPPMISQRNANGDTPIHVASKRGNKEIVELLVKKSKKLAFREVVISDEVEEIDHENPKWAWRVKNSKGNTPLHQALMNGKVEVAKYLLEIDPHLARFVNNNEETPLHLAIKYNVDGEKKFAIEMIDKLNKQRPSLSYKRGCSWSMKVSNGSSMIQLLLKKHKFAVHSRDKYDITPLLQAAVQSQLGSIEMILEECPESSEVSDREGNTILHLVTFQSYEEAMSFMKIQQICALKDHQNDVGDTPAHVAVKQCKNKIITQEQKAFLGEKVCIKDHHIGTIRALSESSANFTLKNMEGLSAATLFQSLLSYFPNYNKRTLLELDMEIQELSMKNRQMMLLAPEDLNSSSKEKQKKIWEAVEGSNLDFLRQELKVVESWLSDGLLRIGDLLKKLLQACKTSDTNNMRYNEVEEFMTQLLKNNLALLCQTNLRGDTFLHTMVRDDDYEISNSFSDQIQHLCKSDRYCYPPWKMRNVDGNTPLHEALMYAPKPRVIKFLLQCDKDVVTYVNNKTETPLHVLCCTEGKEINEEVITEIIKANIQVTYHRDADGRTPLLKAATEGKIGIVIKICEISPDSAQLRDYDGKTFWHLLNMTDATKKDERDLQEIHKHNTHLEDLITANDDQGDTPLRLAVMNKHSKLAEFLMNVENVATKRVYRALEKEDRDMQYHLFLLKFANHLPRKFERTLVKNFDEIGKKSIFGVPEESIKDYINTIGVIAVLTATVAFQAAFQPPGGGIKLEEKTIIRAAYWIFMVSNILTICLSTVVLFCLIWVLTGDKKDKLVVTDLSILLLQGSFITAMISLMTGVFASTYHDTPRLAIFSVIMCTSTLLLLQKFIVMHFLQFLFLTVYLIYEMARSAISGWCNKDDRIGKYGNTDSKKK